MSKMDSAAAGTPALGELNGTLKCEAPRVR